MSRRQKKQDFGEGQKKEQPTHQSIINRRDVGSSYRHASFPSQQRSSIADAWVEKKDIHFTNLKNTCIIDMPIY